MNIYAMVERIIELTEKRKIHWKVCGGPYSLDQYHGSYQGVHIKLWKGWSKELSISEVAVVMTREQKRRLQGVVERCITVVENKGKEQRLQKASDILKG